MLFRRMVITTSIFAVVIGVGVWAAGFGLSAQGGGGPTEPVRIDVDTARVGQVVGGGAMLPDGRCGPRSIEIEGTLEGDELSEEIILSVDDRCRLVVDSIDRALAPAQTAKSASTDWEAWARFRFYGTYIDPDTDEDYWAEAETEVEFFLKEEAGAFTFNSPRPVEYCFASGLPTISNRRCWLEYNVDTSTRKKLGAHGRFYFYGNPQMNWKQSATYDARISGSDRYKCVSGEAPGFLRYSCRGNRTEE